MGVDVSKLVSYGLIGPPTGVTVSKLVAYIVMIPGVEAGAPEPTPRQVPFCYAQTLRRPT